MNIEFSIQEKAWNKVINYAASAYNQFKSEIGGMMVAIEDEAGDWELLDPVIMKQRITPSNTHLDQEELAAYYTKAAMKYKKYNFRFCWWHSHHTMGAFWSGTDTDTIDEFNDGDFSFALVVNLKEEYKFRVSIWKPLEAHKDVELNIITKEKKVPKSIDKEVEALCDKESHNIFHGTNMHQARLFQTEVVQDPKIYTKLYKEVDSLHKKLALGEMTYAAYSSRVNEINEILIADDTGLLIKEVEEKELENLLMVATPAEFIENNDDMADYLSWIGSYGL